MKLKAVVLSGAILASGLNVAQAQFGPSSLPLAPHEQTQPDTWPYNRIKPRLSQFSWLAFIEQLLASLRTDQKGS